MNPIFFIETTNRTPVAGAACWRMNGDVPAELLGTTDITGRYVGDDLTAANFRIYADGHMSVDFTVDPPGNPLTRPVVFLSRLHPGFYSGLYPQKTKATWKQSDSELFVTFRSNGFCQEWQDDGAGGVSSRKTEWQYEATEQDDVWTNCVLRPWLFPMRNTAANTLGPFGAFQFPQPGVMLGRRHADGTISQFDFVN